MLGRQSRLDANHDIAMACDGSARQTDNGTIDIHQLAIWGIAGTRDVDYDRPICGAALATAAI